MSGPPPLSGGGDLGEVPYLRPHPGPAQFVRRAQRFGALATGHTLGDFLEFCGRLSAAQAAACETLAVPAEVGDLPAVRPLDPSASRRDDWIGALRTIAAELESAPMPAPAREGLTRLAALEREALVSLSGKILSGDHTGLDLAAAPFAGAALQVQFTARAARIPLSNVSRAARGCPLCGSAPVAAVVLGDDKLRYLECSLCGSQWHVTRVTCSHCGSAAGVSYFSLEGDPGNVKAEACEACKRYLKLFSLERRPAAEPAADDLATLALDMLVSEQGYARYGVNVFMPS